MKNKEKNQAFTRLGCKAGILLLGIGSGLFMAPFAFAHFSTRSSLPLLPLTPTGVLGVYRHDGTEVVDATKRSKPEPLPVDVDDANKNGTPDGTESGFAPNPDCLVCIKLHKIDGEMFAAYKYRLTFTSKVKVWKEKERQNAVDSGTTEFAVTEDTLLYVEGAAHSDDLKGELLELKTYATQAGNGMLADQANILVFEVKLKELEFNHDPASFNKDAINIRKDKTDSLPLPEYVAGSRNGPAAYVRDKTVTVMAKFDVLPAGITKAKISGRGMKLDKVTTDDGMPLGDFSEKSVRFTKDVTGWEEMAATKKTPDAVDYSEKSWDWRVSEINDMSVGQVVVDRSAGHPIYTLWDVPMAPWKQKAGDGLCPWVSALELAIKKPGTKMKKDNEALALTTQYLFSGFGLKYDTDRGSPSYSQLSVDPVFGNTIDMDLTGYISKSVSKRDPIGNGLTNPVNCYDQASAVNAFGLLMGVSTEMKFKTKFGYLNPIGLIGVGQCNNPFFNSRWCPPAASGKPLVGVDDKRTLFGNHMYVTLNGKVFDACGGPALGTRTEAQYFQDVIDVSKPWERAQANPTDEYKFDPNPFK